MAEARLNLEYAARLLGVGAVMIGICVWSLYDGMKGWPQVNAKMDDARPLLLATNLTVTAWLDTDDDGTSALDRLFAEAGHKKAPGKLARKVNELRLPDEYANDTVMLEKQAQQLKELFEEPVYEGKDLESQWWQAGITLLLGLLACVAVGLNAAKRFVADDGGMRGSGFGKQARAYDDIAAINWARWDEKGIIVLKFKSGKTVKLDGWHFAGMTGIAAELAKHRPDLAPEADVTGQTGQ